MNITQSIHANELMNAERRLATLVKINAFASIIKGAETRIEDLKSGAFKVAHLDEFGELEYSKVEKKAGRGGKVYYQYTTEKGLINYFPYARFGPFVAINRPTYADEKFQDDPDRDERYGDI
jgi:hypothetical protein